MKVSGPSGVASSIGGSAKAAAASGFRIDMPAAAESASRPAGVTGAVGIGGIEALLALQGEGASPLDRRRRAVRKGRSLLEALDRLQSALLGAGPTQSHLVRLQAALAEQREASDDPSLDDILEGAEVRAAVEAAKLERAAARS